MSRPKSSEFTKRNHSFDEALLVPLGEIFIRCLFWIFETRAMGGGCIRYKVRKAL